MYVLGIEGIYTYLARVLMVTRRSYEVSESEPIMYSLGRRLGVFGV